MPSWQPRWDDVGFDRSVASAAARACWREHARLAAVLGQLKSDQASLLETWTGGHARWHRTELAQERRRLARLRADLAVLARRISDGADDAAAEQRRRERQRARWHAEKARERAADRREVVR